LVGGMMRPHLDSLRDRITHPAVFFPLVAALAVIAVFGVIQAGLAATDRWDRSVAARMEYYRAHQPTVLVSRYEERLQAVRVALRKRGYDAGPTGAAMGPPTAEALRSFQRRQGLPVTGRADQPTLTALGLEF
jgi:peptidoglycan hydrolase-like protein with peptidoglycan-binding domain